MLKIVTFVQLLTRFDNFWINASKSALFQMKHDWNSRKQEISWTVFITCVLLLTINDGGYAQFDFG